METKNNHVTKQNNENKEFFDRPIGKVVKSACWTAVIIGGAWVAKKAWDKYTEEGVEASIIDGEY